MTRVSVQAAPQAVQALRRNDLLSPETQELARVLREFGVELRPTHPDTRDPDLSTWFETDAPDLATAKRIASTLQRNSAVTAAYVKPAEETPWD